MRAPSPRVPTVDPAFGRGLALLRVPALCWKLLAQVEGMGSGPPPACAAAAQLGRILTGLELNAPRPLVARLCAAGVPAGIAVLATASAAGGGPGSGSCALHRVSPAEPAVNAEPQLHRALGLYEGCSSRGGCLDEPVC